MAFWVFSCFNYSINGISFAVGKIGLTYSTPILLVGLRFLIAGIIMAIAVQLLRIPYPKSTLSWGRIGLLVSFKRLGLWDVFLLVYGRLHKVNLLS